MSFLALKNWQQFSVVRVVKPFQNMGKVQLYFTLF